MKIFLSICTLALGLSLTSCDLSMLTNRSETNRIERGMTKREVTNILGTPSYRRLATDGSEDWEYRRTNILGETSVVVVTFYDNRVVRMDSYNGDDWDRRRSQRDYPSYPSNPTYPSNPRYPSYPQDPRYEDERDRESFEDFLRIRYASSVMLLGTTSSLWRRLPASYVSSPGIARSSRCSRPLLHV